MNVKRSLINSDFLLKNILNLFLFIITIVFLILPALQNGYPLVFSDTGTYIYSGYDKFVPVDRPVGYGLFIYLFGKLITSLWVIVTLQTIFIIGVCHLFIRLFIPAKRTFHITCLLLISLSLLTGVSNYNSIIIPDIFTPLLLLSTAIILFYNRVSIISKILLALLIIFSVASHFSNLMLAFGVVLFFPLISFTLHFRIQKVNLKKLILAATILLISWIAVPVIHYIHGKEFVWSRAKNVIIMGRFMESGVLKKYLNDKCPDSNIPLCDYRDKMKLHAYEFLWDNDSPLLNGDCLSRGWTNCWTEKDKEYAPIVKEVLTTPKYLKFFAYDSFINSINQLMTFGVVTMTPMNKDSPVQWLIRDHYPKELNQYKSTNQAKNKLFYEGKTLVQNICVVVSLIILVLLLAKKSFRKNLSPQIINIVFFVLTGIVLNAIICATFSGMVDRYQGRIIWLIPLLALLLLVRLIFFKSKLMEADS